MAPGRPVMWGGSVTAEPPRRRFRPDSPARQPGPAERSGRTARTDAAHPARPPLAVPPGTPSPAGGPDRAAPFVTAPTDTGSSR
ncbi:hypothetical protein CP967_22500 [Streptomyces nitrosporeus]|uniref:Uncharacterized protein n=1 Tax=Streptomyces nitrosporeus TaxID=28894 RepID=A0A5J6FHM1_9ACTN|nr:hypothetical protein CP967_22500 [Streptomyces nitrosporeus]GGY95894.1 hypothetical protein GCM10010327_27930 [Streptomyces nitrosporeus]